MSQLGAADILVATRRALLDAMDALAEHRAALVLVGAQAIYLHTGNAPVALAESTKDSDLAINPRQLRDDPLLEDAMKRAGFTHDATDSQPGSWLSPDGIPVDLMVPEQLAGAGSRRSGRVAPHSDRATRRAAGLEAAVIDHAPMTIAALDPNDSRRIEMNVADGGHAAPAPAARGVRARNTGGAGLSGAVVRGRSGSHGFDDGGPRRAARWLSGDSQCLRRRTGGRPHCAPLSAHASMPTLRARCVNSSSRPRRMIAHAPFCIFERRIEHSKIVVIANVPKHHARIPLEHP